MAKKAVSIGEGIVDVRNVGSIAMKCLVESVMVLELLNLKIKVMSQNFESNNFIKIYELNGKEVGLRSEEKMRIKNHDQNKDLVVIGVGEEKVAVSGSDLTRAIQNARNAHKY